MNIGPAFFKPVQTVPVRFELKQDRFADVIRFGGIRKPEFRKHRMHFGTLQINVVLLGQRALRNVDRNTVAVNRPFCLIRIGGTVNTPDCLPG